MTNMKVPKICLSSVSTNYKYKRNLKFKPNYISLEIMKNETSNLATNKFASLEKKYLCYYVQVCLDQKC